MLSSISLLFDRFFFFLKSMFLESSTHVIQGSMKSPPFRQNWLEMAANTSPKLLMFLNDKAWVVTTTSYAINRHFSPPNQHQPPTNTHEFHILQIVKKHPQRRMLSYPLHNPPSLFVVAASDHAVHVILSLYSVILCNRIHSGPWCCWGTMFFNKLILVNVHHHHHHQHKLQDLA